MNSEFLNFAKNIGLEKIKVEKGDIFDHETQTALETEKDETGTHKKR